MRSLYFLIDGFAMLGPFIAAFSPRIRFYRDFLPFLVANFFVGVLFIGWDVLFTHFGVWGFNARYVVGIYFLRLPVEELLFFLCIPFSCVFTYRCLDQFGLLARVVPMKDRAEMIIVGLLVTVAVIFHSRLYTSSAFLSAAFACLVVRLLGGGRLLANCLVTYLFLLIPFFIVNGVLTGTGLAEPVVRYNNAENMGIRILTIPVEDLFYGFSLIALNIGFFEVLTRDDQINI